MQREITVKEAAALLGLSDRRIRCLALEGRIVGARRITPRMWVIPVGEDGKPVVVKLKTKNPKRFADSGQE